jgi:hypothetical protein
VEAQVADLLHALLRQVLGLRLLLDGDGRLEQDKNIGSEATRTMARRPMEITISMSEKPGRRGARVGYM